MGLAIDQLQYSNDFAMPILHRKREQGTRPVACFLVVSIVEVIWPATRNVIGIGKVDDFPAHCRTTSQGIFTHRKDKFLEGKLKAIILGELEPKLAFPGACV